MGSESGDGEVEGSEEGRGVRWSGERTSGGGMFEWGGERIGMEGGNGGEWAHQQKISACLECLGVSRVSRVSGVTGIPGV